MDRYSVAPISVGFDDETARPQLREYRTVDESPVDKHRANAVRPLAARLELLKQHIEEVSLQIKELAWLDMHHSRASAA